jgi:hypothetical protein
LFWIPVRPSTTRTRIRQANRYMSSSSMNTLDGAALRERLRGSYDDFHRGRVCSWPSWRSFAPFCLDDDRHQGDACVQRRALKRTKSHFVALGHRLGKASSKKREGTDAMMPPLYFVSFSCINILEGRSSFPSVSAIGGVLPADADDLMWDKANFQSGENILGTGTGVACE